MSSTCEIQLEAPIVYPSPQAPPTSSSKFHASILDGNDRQAKSLAVVHPQQQWNRPQINMWRVFATFVSFILMGANDAAYGVWPPPTRMKSHVDQFQALIPYLEQYYHLTYTVVSLVFLSPLVGYVLAALLNNAIHMRFGQRGVSLLGPGCHVLAYAVLSVHPPYPALVITCIVAGFGNGLMDAAWNAWIGNMAKANELLGFLHGFYGLGATLSPLIATTMVTKGRLEWYAFYYIMLGGAVLELIVGVTTFWGETGARFRAANPRTSNKKGGRTREALSDRVTWLLSLFLLGYVGIEVALGGWIVTFMIRVRHGDPFSSGISAVGFWLGITIGRVILGFTTPHVGEKLAIAIYLGLAMALELVFWLVPRFGVSAAAVAFLGFFLGPLFPGAVVAATKLLPQHLHVGAIGFAAAFGGTGAAVFPFAVGALSQARGVQVLQPVVLALLGAVLGLWLAVPGKMKHAHET